MYKRGSKGQRVVDMCPWKMEMTYLGRLEGIGEVVVNVCSRIAVHRGNGDDLLVRGRVVGALYHCMYCSGTYTEEYRKPKCNNGRGPRDCPVIALSIPE